MNTKQEISLETLKVYLCERPWNVLKMFPEFCLTICFSNVYGFSFYKRHIFKVFFLKKWKIQK